MVAPASEGRKARVILALVLAVGLANGSHAVAQTGRADYERQTKSDSYKRAQRLVKEAGKLYEKGRTAEAIDLHRRAGELFASSVGAASVEVATAFQLQGELWLLQPTASGERDYARAEPLFKQAWATFEAVRSTGALPSDATGDATLALRNWLRCLREQGKKTPATLVSRLMDLDLQSAKADQRRYMIKRGLKDLLWSSDFEGARQLLAILEPRVADLRQVAEEAIGELAAVLDPSERPGYQVGADFDRLTGRAAARERREQLFPAAAKALRLRDFDTAERLLTEAEKTADLVERPPGEYIIGDAPVLPDRLRLILSAAVLFDLRYGAAKSQPYLDRAKRLLRRTIGLQAANWPELSELAILLDGRADQLWREGDDAGASLRALVAARLTATRLRFDLAALDNAEQLALLQGAVPGHTSRLLSMCGSSDCLTEAYSLMLSWKGVLVQQLRQEAVSAKASSSAAREAEWVNLRKARQVLAGLLHLPPPSLSVADRDAAKLAAFKTKSDVEESLRRQSRLTVGQAVREIITSGLGDQGVAVFGLAIDPLRDIGASGDVDGFASLLEGDEIFLDAYRYVRLGHDGATDVRYGIIIIAPGKAARFVDVGPARRLEDRIAAWRDATLRGEASVDRWNEVRADIWEPLGLDTIVGNRPSNIWFSPDAELARIPVNLFCESSCLSLVTQIDSPREFARLRRIKPVRSSERRLVVAGDINYGRQAGGPQLFRPLEWTGREADNLTALAKGAGISVSDFRKDALTKSALASSADTATYVHLATHGFFESSERYLMAAGVDARNVQPADDRIALSTYAHPLLMSGIALSSANTSNPSNYEALGLLTAEEVIGMDLSNAELVTLSACETGRGAEVTGQGVVGLRGALMSTGVRSALLSLWNVGDDSTVEFMRRFYERLWRDGDTKANALKLAQQSMKDDPKWSAPVHWAAWILAGEAW